ncbi:hypothetical protein BKA63DRAFT_428474, partial [Paraphoma chrysanthemicola]
MHAAPVQSETSEDIVKEWLNTPYIRYRLDADGEVMITAEDFTNLTNLAFPEAYMSGETLTLALALAIRKHDQQSEATILGDADMTALYQLGIGVYSLENTRVVDFRDELREAILNDSKRWIILPVSDGL